MSNADRDTARTGGLYRILCRLDGGGMGEVSLAVRRAGAFERLFALKRLRKELLCEPEVRAMFFEEARLAGLIHHPNVVPVLDVGEDAEGPFLLMEYVEGIAASELIRSARGASLPLGLCLRIGRDVAEGLHAAHEATDAAGRPLNLVHRDVSPQNILVGFDGVARVTDFGIAKALGRTTQTATGVLKGKLAYMAPEQLRFEEPDRRADLFALGVVLFELLSGQRLYASKESLDGPRRILTEPPPDLADYRDDAEPELVDLLFRLLAKEREARPATARDVASALETCLTEAQAMGDGADVAVYLMMHHAGARAALQAAINDARAEQAAASNAPARELAAHTTRAPARWNWRRTGLGLVAAAALGGIGLASWQLTAPQADSTAPTPSATTQTVMEQSPRLAEPSAARAALAPAAVAAEETRAAAREPTRRPMGAAAGSQSAEASTRARHAQPVARPPAKNPSQSAPSRRKGAAVPIWENY